MTENYFSTVAAKAGQESLGAPADDEVEITVMGSGAGESIVVHLGRQKWLIIDSFRLPQRRRDQMGGWTPKPAPVQYLKELGVDPSTSVSAVIVTHPHYDHYQGIVDVLSECTGESSGATFYLPAGLSDEKLATLARSAEASGQIEQLRQATCEADRLGRLDFMHGGTSPQNLSNLTVLAPLPAARLTNALRRRTIENSPNLASIVLWIEVEEIKALLGGDLDRSAKHGWGAVLQSQRGRLENASFVKVPHHGSKTAHDESIYLSLASNRFLAAGTANLQGASGESGRGRSLPHTETVEFLDQHAEKVAFVGGKDGRPNSNPGSSFRLGWVRARAPIDDSNDWEFRSFGKVSHFGGKAVDPRSAR